MALMTIADDETFVAVGDYLERCGVAGLRHPHASERFNKTAILRHLMATALQDALDHPPAPAGQKTRHGVGGKRPKLASPVDTSTKSRK